MESSRVLVYLNSDRMGTGDDELGKILVRNFLISVRDELAGKKGVSVFLANSGVRLACEGTHVRDVFEEMASSGVRIFSCGTCLDFFGLRESLVTGEAGGMKYYASMACDPSVRIVRP